MISKFLRCFGVASNKRHDHAKGTLMVRPSASCAHIARSVTFTETIRGSLTAAVLIPCPRNLIKVIEDGSSDAIQFFR
jgi:hypothetical protein